MYLGALAGELPQRKFTLHVYLLSLPGAIFPGVRKQAYILLPLEPAGARREIEHVVAIFWFTDVLKFIQGFECPWYLLGS